MTIDRHYAEVNEDGVVVQVLSIEDPDIGPPAPPHSSNTCFFLDNPIDWGEQPSNTATLMWGAGGLQWVETAPLAEVVTEVLAQIDTDADVARVSVLVKTTKAEEYMQAETQARAWKESDYAGDAPPDVASWAAAKWRESMTGQQAAESILAQAGQYRNLLSGIRALRLKHMEDARHAADAAGARGALAAFTTDLSNLMKGTA